MLSCEGSKYENTYVRNGVIKETELIMVWSHESLYFGMLLAVKSARPNCKWLHETKKFDIK